MSRSRAINGQTLFQLEDGTVTAERPQKRTAVSLANFRRMLEPTYLKLLLRSLKIALFTTIHLPAAGLSRRVDSQQQGF